MKLILGLLFAGLAFGQHSITINLAEPAGGVPIATFGLSRSTVSGGPYTLIATFAASITTYVDSGTTASPLLPGVMYCYVAVAASASTPAATSANSNEVCFSVPSTAPLPPVLSLGPAN
jgi:hypothetical protein